MSDAKTFPPDQRQASLSLWRMVGGFLNTLFSLFGEPQELAQQHTFTFKQHKLILPWLRAGEALLRRFLLLEAALLEPPSGAPAPSPASSKKPHARQPVELDPNNPDSWRVSFRFNTSPACGGSGSRRGRETMGGDAASSPSDGFAATSPARGGGADRKHWPRFRSALPLALRFEAILRAYNNPTPFARRLAARLRKASALIKRITNDSWENSRNLIDPDFFDALIAPIAEAQRLLTDTS